LIVDVAQGLTLGRIDDPAAFPCCRFDMFDDGFLDPRAQSVGVQRV